MRPATPLLVITKSQREVLDKLARSRTAAHREVQRARVLLMAADGEPNAMIAATVGVSATTVKNWRERFACEGLRMLPIVTTSERTTTLAGAGTLARADELNASYRSAQPWPHAVLGDLFAPALVRAAYEEERARLATLPSHANRRQAKAETSEGLGPAARAILAFLDSPEWVRLMEVVTGVDPLLADPTHFWGGLHSNGPGAFHALHRDFVKHPENGLWHRANVLVYLNPEWPDGWGGQLELWRPRGRGPERVVAPKGGTVVVFETHAGTLHGLPEPIACPPGEARLSLNAFYYSEAPPPGPILEPLLRRPRRPQDPWSKGIATPDEIAHGVRERLPEPVLRLGRAVKRRLGR